MADRAFRTTALIAVLLLTTILSASAALQILDSAYQPDQMLPEWNYFYSSGYKPGDATGARIQGGHICVYLYNNGAGSVTINDFLINGESLKNGIILDTSKAFRCELNGGSVYFGGSGPRTTLINAGEPVWWRADPTPIPANGVGEVVVRMRSTVAGSLSCSVVPTSGSAVPVTISVSGATIPRIVDYSYVSSTNKLYLYLRHPQKGKVPTAVYLDQNNVTSICNFAADTDVDVVAVKVNLTSSLARGSYHVFKAVYDDGTKASFGLRIYSDGFKYGTWSAPDMADTAEQRAFLYDLGRHSVNLFTMGMGGLDIIKTTEGKAIMDQYGMKRSHDEKTTDRLYSIFTCDEPDAGEDKVDATIGPYTKTGTLAQSMIHRIRDSFRGSYAIYPTTINMDGGDCPYNWYTYGHVADMFCHDGYYLPRLNDALSQPSRLPFFQKCTWRYASAQTAKVACEPRREHIIIESDRVQEDDGSVHRWPTPAENHIMTYYTIAAGAKEIGYWWLTELGNVADGSNGLANQPGSIAMWREMGLVGAELGTVGNLIVNSTPAVFPITAPGKLWVRSLVSGIDTIMLICVNDDYTNDKAGTILRPIKNVQVGFDLPSWLSSPTDVFEVDYKGVRDVSKSISSGNITMSLGRVDVTRMLIITKDSALKGTLQTLYANTYGPRVAELIPLP